MMIASKNYDNAKKIECRYYKQFFSSIIIPENVVYPVPVDDITLWEQCNIVIKINVFELDERFILVLDSLDKNINLINLLLYKIHYIWILTVLSF